MSKSYNIQRDCTEYCRSVVHGNQINNALTNLDISGLHFCSYLNYLCTNCDLVKDSVGRTALHASATYGYIEVVRWLLNNKNANINARDDESGYTPLHRALYHGRIHVAVELIKAGADLTIRDKDGLTPYDHVIKDGLKPYLKTGILYTWGLNKNNSLGSFSARSAPECLDLFHRKYPREKVQQICIDQFHSIIISSSGSAYSCGHGLGGRLGLGSEKTVVEPKKINFRGSDRVEIVEASISKNHSLFLTSEREVHACGINTHRVLGLKPPPSSCHVPERLKFFHAQPVYGISTAQYHSAAWTSKKLYTWGLNGGQLGHEAVHGNHIISPKEVRSIVVGESDIKKVVSSDGATAVLTGKGDVYVISDFMCRRIVSRLLHVIDLTMIGGKLNTDIDEVLKIESSKELRVILLTNTGHLLLWQESDPRICRCSFSIPRTLTVNQVSMNCNDILFVTNYGECYTGIIQKKRHKIYWDRKDSPNLPVAPVTISKIPRIYRAISIASDSKGEDFCVIQQKPYGQKLMYEYVNIKKEMQCHLSKLLDETTEQDDIHDVIIKINYKVFPAHKYILATESNLLDLCNNNDEIILKDVNVEFFQQILHFIYTGTCTLLEAAECPPQFVEFCLDSCEVSHHNSKSNKLRFPANPIRMLQELSKSFGCMRLHHVLNDYFMVNTFIFRKGNIVSKLKCYQREEYPQYHDITLKCSDNKELKAHKCILIARLEYFNNLFAARWGNGNRSSVIIPYPSNLVEALLEFLYTDSQDFLSAKDGDFLMKLLVLADEYLVEQLKRRCAFLIVTMDYLDLKNAIEILQVAQNIKCTILINGVMGYVVHNLLYFLETKALEDLSDEILSEISTHYIGYMKLDRRYLSYNFETDCSRKIADIHSKHPINLEISEKRKNPLMNKIPRRKFKRNSINEKNFQKSSDDEKDESKEDNEISCAPPVERDSVHNNQERLLAICTATKMLENMTDEPNYTNLKNLSLSNSFDEFPLLNSPPEVGSHHRVISSPCSGKSMKKHKMIRLSQKERMRLSSESKDTAQIAPETPKNPWKKIPDVAASIATSPSDTSFCGILSDERKLKENLVKLTNKSLILTQIEDKAIMDLEKFYNINGVEDEVITVQRVDVGNIASPVWIPGTRAQCSHS